MRSLGMEALLHHCGGQPAGIKSVEFENLLFPGPPRMVTQHRPSALDLFSVAACSFERGEAGLGSTRHNLPSSADARARASRVSMP